MRKLARYLQILCLVLLGMYLKPQEAKASHAAGAEIVYEWISDSTYRFIIKFYRDCGGIATPGSFQLCFYNPCSGLTFSRTADLYSGLIPNSNPALPPVPNGTPVSAGCSDSATTCDSPSSVVKGYQEWWYVVTEKLDGQCNAWRFAISEAARNGPQQNLTGGGTDNLYVETTFNNVYAQGNSSPYFSVKPIPFCCEGVPFSYNNVATDPDPGDSLSHQMILPLNTLDCSSTNTTCGVVTGISLPSNPLETGGTFSISATTGQMSFTPSMAGVATITELVKEWRNGVLIGSIMRDMQVQILPAPCSGVPVPPTPGVTNVINGIWTGNRVEACEQQPLSFQFVGSSTANDARLIMSNTGLTGGPAGSGSGMTVTYTGQRTKNVTGTFNWTPPAGSGGSLYLMSVKIVDSTCRPPGILYNHYQTIEIYVWPPTVALGDTAICPGDSVRLTVRNGGDYLWSIDAGPAGSLGSTTGATVKVYPTSNTRYKVESKLNDFCARNWDTVTVQVLPVPQYTPMPDVVTCPGIPKVLDPQVVMDPGVTYNINWSPGTYLSSTTGPTVTTTPNDSLTYFVVIEASNSVCKAKDTVIVDVLKGFTILTGDTAICAGGKVPVRAVGDPRYTYAWSTDDPGLTSVFDDPTALTPVITPTNTVFKKFTYTLTATAPACPGKDSIADFTIDVQPNPVVKVDDDNIICFGDTMLLTGIVTPPYAGYTYKWSPGLALDNPNIPNPIFSALNVGETELTLVVSTSAGCKNEDKVKLTVLPADFIFPTSDTAICPGDSIQIGITGVGLESFFWAYDDAISDVNSATPFIYPSSTRDYVIYGRDTNTCYDTQMIHIVVRPAPIVSLPDSVTLFPGQSYQITPGGNATYYSWFPPVGLSAANISNPLATPLVNTRYIVTGTTEAGCSTTDSINIIISAESLIDMPNAFAPGGNARLKPSHLGDVKLVNFSIYNRWGTKVFESNDIAQGWDGRYNNDPQPMGVYIYTIDAVTPTGKRFSKQGNITLIR